ncbi:MAG: TrbC/VirB2 family protein [Burkholderiaceae bacterium]|nr:TrbC/VirB2 family protein [Burkholderiaceae bacterium]MDP3139481.1 TrbC/VirB2 family protein [Burkholderiaceae bacterium]
MTPKLPNHLKFEITPQAFFIAAVLLLPAAAFAQTSGGSGFTLPFITGIGCDIVKWMKGELAIIVFILVAVATFVIGLFAKMDWTKILSVVVIYGILQGLIGILLSTNTIRVPSCFN